MIYLDHNATAPLLPEVLQCMLPYFGPRFGNPSSVHRAGRDARAALDDARERLAAVLHARPHEIIFTGGGTESDNLAILGLARSLKGRGQHLVTSATEHHAVLHAFEYLEKREAFEVSRLPVDRFGVIDLRLLRDVLRPDTTLVSIMTANNETGVLQPTEEIALICRERGVLFHTDAVQSFGKIPLPLAPNLPDAISLAAHKFYGPKGAGLLYLRAGVPLEKIQFGGFHENERRPGTENVACIVGMARAAEIAVRDSVAEHARQGVLRDRLWSGISALFPEAVQNGHPSLRLANTLNVTFTGLDAETMLINLDLEGICASTGSACMVGSILPSHVLQAMALSNSAATSAIRFSLGKETSACEIESVIAALERVLPRLQSLRQHSSGNLV